MFFGLQANSLLRAQPFQFHEPKIFLRRVPLGLDVFNGLALAFRGLAQGLDLTTQRLLISSALFSLFISINSQSLQFAKALRLLLGAQPSLVNPLLLLKVIPTCFVFQFAKPASFLFRA